MKPTEFKEQNNRNTYHSLPIEVTHRKVKCLYYLLRDGGNFFNGPT